jgi:hypothetical protein
MKATISIAKDRKSEKKQTQRREDVRNKKRESTRSEVQITKLSGRLWLGVAAFSRLMQVPPSEPVKPGKVSGERRGGGGSCSWNWW